MKKFIRVMLVAMLVVGLAALVGCGGKKTTTTGEIRTNEGTTTVTGTVTEKEIGIPIYPGAKMDENSAGTVKSKNEKGEEVWSAAVLWTDDSVSEVVAWYRDKLKGKSGFTDLTQGISTSATGEQMGMFAFQEGDTFKMVTIGKGNVDHPGKTEIGITSGSGPGVPPIETPVETPVQTP
ncbi:MAG: hypothetical protein MUP40_02245 [Actinobacteria bacterium]|nr:hypothetical protein [Actinomycetota bacterium]